MSFSFDVKEEICRVAEKDAAAKIAELYGMTLLGQTVERDYLKISTENVLVINRLQNLSSDLLGVFFEMNEVGITYTASMKRPALDKLYDYLRMSDDFAVILDVKEDLIRNRERFYAFLRGAVLSGGYFSDPVSGYHFELVTPNYVTAKSILDLMNRYGIPCKSVVRRSNYVVYLKDSQQIYNLLYRLGARSSAFELMNVKIEKETNNNNNRVDNCVAYNMDKALNKAVEQIRAIDKIQSKVGLASLAEDLQFVAELRKANPTANLNELTTLSNGKMSKPSLSRKLNKIIEIASNIKG